MADTFMHVNDPQTGKIVRIKVSTFRQLAKQLREAGQFSREDFNLRPEQLQVLETIERRQIAEDSPEAAAALGALRGSTFGLSDVVGAQLDPEFAQGAEELKQANPAISFGSEIVGGLATGAGAGVAAGKTGATTAQAAGRSLLGRTLEGAGKGAAATTGFTLGARARREEDLLGDPGELLENAAVGAAGGALFPLAGAGLKSVAAKAGPGVRGAAQAVQEAHAAVPELNPLARLGLTLSGGRSTLAVLNFLAKRINKSPQQIAKMSKMTEAQIFEQLKKAPRFKDMTVTQLEAMAKNIKRNEKQLVDAAAAKLGGKAQEQTGFGITPQQMGSGPAPASSIAARRRFEAGMREAEELARQRAPFPEGTTPERIRENLRLILERDQNLARASTTPTPSAVQRAAQQTTPVRPPPVVPPRPIPGPVGSNPGAKAAVVADREARRKMAQGVDDDLLDLLKLSIREGK